MERFKNLFIAVVLLILSAIIFTSCQNEQNPVGPQEFQHPPQSGLSKFSMPAGATFESATFYVYVEFAGGKDIDVHRITNPWEACEVTWNSFGGSYAPEVEGTFNSSTEWSWHSSDVTNLVGGWINGTYPNYGLLLNQVDTSFGLTTYAVREKWDEAAYLEICYTDAGGTTVCDTTKVMQDTFIYELTPDENRCDTWVLFQGWDYPTDKAKQPLFMFDIEVVIPQEECTRTPIYWKRHTEYGPGTRDSNWDLILPSGENSDFFLSEKSYYEVLQRSPFGNAYYRLARQYIAAKLNVLSGASIPAEVQVVFDSATDLLNTYTPAEVRSWRFFHPIRRQFRSNAFILHKYNWGIIGPGRCGS